MHATRRQVPSAPLSALPGPALRYRSGRSSLGKPSNWLPARFADRSSPPSRGEIGSPYRFRQSQRSTECRLRMSC
ncbi:MAG: hypothetical protein E5V58_17495 [Mesorhizobium sp.]|nr:hypothetical protein EN738_05895 [Mesorhizobium sp. M4B.F.Ca.ET.017.02.2.1]RWC92541.1 MAG: hypothetical protein EOS32_25995 [Mesorhizobium sp.]TIW71878.1 MAG: hypothetical protein E5V58_17495 [Mesorhizobium sp.]